jgi:hypothetical protein
MVRRARRDAKNLKLSQRRLRGGRISLGRSRKSSWVVGVRAGGDHGAPVPFGTDARRDGAPCAHRPRSAQGLAGSADRA